MTTIDLFPAVDSRSHIEIRAAPAGGYLVEVVKPNGERIRLWSGLWYDEAWEKARRGRFRYGLKEIWQVLPGARLVMREP